MRKMRGSKRLIVNQKMLNQKMMHQKIYAPGEPGEDKFVN